MRAVKRLFHPLNLLLIIVVLALYLNRDTLFAELGNSAEVEAVRSRVDSAIGILQSEAQLPAEGAHAEGEDIAFSQVAGSDMPSPGNVTAAQAEDMPQQAALTAAASAGGMTPDPEAENATAGSTEAEAETPPETGDIAADAVERDEATQGAEDMAETPLEGPATESAKPAVTREQLLRTMQHARRAAWRGEFNTAIEYYQTVITLQPENIDAYGEMGNVMFRCGDREGAAEAYYQAARRLNRTPRYMMAWHLLNVIAVLSPPRAEQLHRELLRDRPGQ